MSESKWIIDAIYKDEPLRLFRKSMVKLFDADRTVVKNIFINGKSDEIAVCANLAHTAENEKRYQTEFYNLDAIAISCYYIS